MSFKLRFFFSKDDLPENVRTDQARCHEFFRSDPNVVSAWIARHYGFLWVWKLTADDTYAGIKATSVDRVWVLPRDE